MIALISFGALADVVCGVSWDLIDFDASEDGFSVGVGIDMIVGVDGLPGPFLR